MGFVYIPFLAANFEKRVDITAATLSEQRDPMKSFARRVLTDLAPAGVNAKPSPKLLKWPTLNFKEIDAEVKRQFKESIALNDRDAWHARFEQDRNRIVALADEICRCQSLLDAAVESLFGVTEEEAKLMER